MVYPDSDGKPMAENTAQYEVMVLLKENLDGLFPGAFVAADLFWYPIEGHPEIVLAPDVLVAVGRPKGFRSSYRTWDEAGIAPQVVIEIWSPGNTFPEQVKKLRFYEFHGVQEFYIYDQERGQFSAWIRKGATLEPVATDAGWTSPLLGVRMQVRDGELKAWGPNGEPFLTTAQLRAVADAARAEADAVRFERDALLAQLRAAGIAPRGS